MKIIILITFILSTACSALQAQALEGKITDPSGMPLMDAYIFKTGGKVHSHSNELGIFYCEDVFPGDTIFVSYLGYQTQSILMSADHFKEPMDIVLQEKKIDLNQVVVTNKVRALHEITKVDLQTNPVNSSQEVLRRVPGLFIGQHAGGGKAEQIFLRGFDIDHGTDVQITVDGMPVNMVSHAHGQGYADLHFLIPETIERIDFGKGPYYAEKGNFCTAGYVEFQTKDKLDKSLIGVEAGQFNTFRTVALLDLLPAADDHNAYIATEYMLTDGPVDSPQNFNRLNLMGKYTINLPDNGKLSVLASHLSSKWDASGQVPQRAVDAGLITRFGSIDDTEGGFTSRTNLSLNLTKSLSKDQFLKSRIFYSKYDFELYSNFTFWLNDPNHGDQIRQKEHRQIFGLESVLHQQFRKDDFDANLQTGIGIRYDRIHDDELSHTLNRVITLENIAFGDVNESNVYGFANLELDFGKFLINPGLRLDLLKFDYVDQLASNYETLSETRAILAPKLNLIYNPNRHWQLFLKSGVGFHSNDTRVVVARQGREVLPAAYGTDLGLIWKPFGRIWFHTALWYLFLEQEFVYVGDEGVVEPSGKTRRLGLDFGIRWQIADWLFFDADLNYALARAVDEPEQADYIPLAPDLTAIGGLSMNLGSGWTGGIRSRFMNERPANEDNSITAKGYFITDVNLNYTFGRITTGIMIENLFDAAWNETQFATESRLKNELEPVEEIHFTPGVPFFLKGRVQYRF